MESNQLEILIKISKVCYRNNTMSYKYYSSCMEGTVSSYEHKKTLLYVKRNYCKHGPASKFPCHELLSISFRIGFIKREFEILRYKILSIYQNDASLSCYCRNQF